jgi:hypothetical protein
MKFISRAHCLALATCLGGALCSSWGGDWRTDAEDLENHVLYSNSLATARHVELLLPRWTASTNGPYQTNLVNAMASLVNAMASLGDQLRTNVEEQRKQWASEEVKRSEGPELTNAGALGRLELYTEMALTHADQMTELSEYRLLCAFPWRHWNRTLDTNNFVAERHKQLLWWLHAVEQAEAVVKAAAPIDPTNRPVRRVPLPPGTGITPLFNNFVEPSAIKDPALRAQYEQALAENRRKLAYLRARDDQERSARLVAGQVRFYILSLYCQKPFMTAEARRLVSASKIKPETKKRILDALSEMPD